MTAFSLFRRAVARPRLLPLCFVLGGMALLVRAGELGPLTQPGPGLWPGCVGLGLAGCGGLLLLPSPAANPPAPAGSASPPPAREPGGASAPHLRALAGLAAACLLWLLLLPPLGWVPATLAAVAVCCRAAGNSLTQTLLLMILLVGGLHFGVERLLHWPLPGGWL